MSRFWGGGSDSDSDDDDVEQQSQDEGSSVESGDEGSRGAGSDGERGDFFERADSDDDEPDVKRVVRSQRDKRNEALNNSIRAIKNALKISDWVAIQDEFDNLLKIVQKAGSATEKLVTPRAFIRCLVALEDAVETSWTTDDKKKMSASKQKGLSTMKQKLRKAKAQYENEVNAFRQKPVDTDQSEEERAAAAAAEAPEEDEDKEDKAAENETFTAEDVDKKVVEILASRGKKNVNRKRQIDVLHTLLAVAEDPLAKIRVLLTVVSIRFDQVTGIQVHMPADAWKLAHGEFNQVLGVLEANDSIVVTTQIDEGGAADEGSESAKKFAAQGKRPLAGSLVAIVERLDDEFTKSLQNTDPHTTDYIERLRDEADLYATIVRAQHYYSRPAEGDRDVEALSRTIMRRVEHVYYKPDVIGNALERKVHERLGRKEVEVDSAGLMQQLCAFLYKNSNELIRTRALLCHVFHHALHGRYYKARDLMLMSHLQEMIQHADISTKILYNRAMVQTGICAFRHGMLKESQHALQDIHSTTKVKELLAQGIVMQKGTEKTSEQERLEKQRQVPFHMHVNLELLECIFLTCSMILEVPYMAGSSFDTRKKVVSKPFRRILDFSDKQLFTGPPENTREHIMQATKALMSGDWEKAVGLILGAKIWELMSQAEDVIKPMLASKIQRAGLQTYLLSYTNFYDTVSLDSLAAMFKLTRADVHGIVSKMIVNEDLSASLDQVAGVIVVNRAEPSKIHHLALQFTDKAQALIEINEKILEVRTGNLGGREDRQQQNRGDQGQGQQSQRVGGYRQGGGGRQQGGAGADGKRQFNPRGRFQRNTGAGGDRSGSQNRPNNRGERSNYQGEGQSARPSEA